MPTSSSLNSFKPKPITRQTLGELALCLAILTPYILTDAILLSEISCKLDFRKIRQINPNLSITLARDICLLIPSTCSQSFRVGKKTISACSLNPLNEELMIIRFKALSYLVDCKCTIPESSVQDRLPDIAKSIRRSLPVIKEAYKVQNSK